MDFFEDLERRHRIQLTKEQKEAILHTKGYHLLLACPGSGKTTVMVVKTAYLITELSVDARNILSLTFTRAAALDMKRRYIQLFENDPGLSFSTIHSFCFGIMQRYFEAKGISKENLEGKNSRNQRKSNVLKHICRSIYGRNPNDELVEEVSNGISYIKNLMLTQETFVPTSLNIKNIKEIYRSYEEYKTKYGFYDFDDMLLVAYQALLEDKGLLDQLRKRYRYIQVDEAQDNSKLQNEILRLLITEKSNLFMVADDDQTIYEWRGAYPKGILDFERVYPKGMLHRMEQNFRSSQNIVALSNRFIKQNRIRFDKNLMTHNPDHSPIEIIYTKNLRDEMNALYKRIKENKEELGKQAILYRNNRSIILLAHKLEEWGIEFTTQGYNNRFFKHWIVRDILCFFLFAQTGETKYFEKIYYKNDAYISKKDFERCKGLVTNKKSVLDILAKDSELQYYQRKNILLLRANIKSLLKKPVEQGIVYIQKDIGYEKWLKNAGENFEISIEGVRAYLSILKEIAKTCKDISGFINRLEHLERILGEVNHKDEGITLSTVHGAKGLEFDTVFMIDLEEGVFPSSESSESNALLEAERRLFYVGMTRARNKLFLMSPSLEGVSDSQFLREIREIQTNE